MAKAKLPYFVYSGDDECFDLTPTQWDSLERAFGAELTEADRIKLIEVTTNYLHQRRAEQEAIRIRNLEKELQALGAIVNKFSHLAWGEFAAKSELTRWLEQEFARNIGDAPILIGNEPPGFDTQGNLLPRSKGEPVQLHLSMDSLMKISFSLVRAVEKIRERLQADSKAQPENFRDGKAFTEWLSEMRRWAHSQEFPHGGWKVTNSLASALSALLFEINGLIPKRRRTSVASVEAMATRIDNAPSPRTARSRAGQKARP